MFEVYATRWDNAHIVEELIPARGLMFNLPLMNHGRASFSATVEPRRSFWRPALSCAMSGILVAENGVPVWQGRMLSEHQSGQRTFNFEAAEWGSFFEKVSAVPFALTNTNDHVLQRRLISDAQAVVGQDCGIILGTTFGASASDLTINAWDGAYVAEEFRRLGEHAGGPEWYFASTGTLENPTRTLVQGDRLGSTTPVAVFEYVEDTEDWVPPAYYADLFTDRFSDTFGSLFPGAQPYAIVGGRRGGNVIAHMGRGQSPGITVAIAVGAGDQLAQLRKTASAMALLAAGYPRQTEIQQYTDVVIPATLQKHADADLAAGSGMTTTYNIATFGSDPVWTGIARGDTVRVEADTDVYATERPLVFNTRVLDIAVLVPDQGEIEVTYVVADVREN
jgi:hypothetical protein